MLTPLETGIFGSIAGLPMHPLVVHFAVVLLPLAALALVLLVAVPRWADRYGWVTLAALVAGTAAAFVAKESGEALAVQVGNPKSHAAWGDLLPPMAVGLVVLAGIWYFLHRRAGGAGKPRSAAAVITGLLAAVLAIGVTGVTVLVGHSGAEAAWAGVAQGDQVQTQPSPAGDKPTLKPTASTAKGSYSLAEVAKHGEAAACWSAVNGQVYDLTKWINQHPGGARRIVSMCGKDATAAFEAQHGGQGRAEQALSQFKIGQLA